MADTVQTPHPLARPAQRWTSEEAWGGTRRPIGQARGLDPLAYTDPGFHDVELDRVFERSWVCVGLVDEMRTPGAMLVRRLGRRSILITRTEDGTVRGFLNSCRHRGTELAEADCTMANHIRCPYHRWTYAIDGTLVATPRFSEEARTAATESANGERDLDLVPVRVATWGCLIFACLDERTESLEARLGDLPARLAGYQLESWSVTEATEVDIAANWKLISENYQEYYHLPWVHPDLSSVSRVEDHYRYQGPGMYCGQTTTPLTDAAGSSWLSLAPTSGLDESDSVSGRFLAIFPNVLLSVLPNHALVMRLEPVAPAQTKEHCAWLLPPGHGESGRDGADDGEATDSARAGFALIRRLWLDVNGEDIDIVERSQRGLAGGAVRPGPLVPRFEEPLHRFHNILADHFTVDDPGQIAVPAGDEAGADEAIGGRTNPTPPAVERGRASQRDEVAR